MPCGCVRSEEPPLPLLWPRPVCKTADHAGAAADGIARCSVSKPPPLPRHAAVPVAEHGDSLVVIRPGAPIPRENTWPRRGRHHEVCRNAQSGVVVPDGDDGILMLALTGAAAVASAADAGCDGWIVRTIHSSIP